MSDGRSKVKKNTTKKSALKPARKSISLRPKAKVNKKDISPSSPPPNHSRNKTLLLFTALLIVTALIWLGCWFFYFQYHESTDDAYANGSMVTVNSAVPGSVVAFFTDDTALVTKGQLLVQLDSTEYQAAYEKELATLASVVLQVRQLYDIVSARRENVESKRIALSRTRFDYENRSKVIDSGAVSKEDYIHSKDAFLTAESDLKLALDELQIALDGAGNTTIEKHPLIEQQRGAVREAYYNLAHCAIYAPTTGYVAQRTVDVGQWVLPITSMMAILPPDYVWVDANYKETQLTYMRIGQPATVWFDIYGSKVKYKGVVLGIGPGTGSVFSLIPPQNATGNWIKIVQRIAVRIGVDPEVVKKYPMRIGLSAEVDVDITNQDLPMLAEVPSTQALGTTDVFDIHLGKADAIMNNIIQENLKK